MIKKNNLVLTINIGNRNFIKYTGGSQTNEKTGLTFYTFETFRLTRYLYI